MLSTLTCFMSCLQLFASPLVQSVAPIDNGDIFSPVVAAPDDVLERHLSQATYSKDQLTRLAFCRLDLKILTGRTISVLRRLGVDLDVNGPRGSSLLIEAIYANDLRVVGELLAQKVQVNTPNQFGWRPLDVALLLDRAVLRKKLCEVKGEQTVGHPATRVRTFIDMFGDESALKILVAEERDQVAELRDPRGESLLSLAVRYRSRAAARCFANNDQIANIINWNGQSVLHIGAQMNFWIGEFKLDRFSELLNKQDDSGFTPLMYAAKYSSTEFITRAVDAGAKVDHPGWAGATPLYIAVLYQMPASVRELLRLGARVDIATTSGDLPINLAKTLFRDDLVELLSRQAIPEDQAR